MKYNDFVTQRFCETVGTETDIGIIFNFATFDIVGEVSTICKLTRPQCQNNSADDSKWKARGRRK